MSNPLTTSTVKTASFITHAWSSSLLAHPNFLTNFIKSIQLFASTHSSHDLITLIYNLTPSPTPEKFITV